MGSNLKRRTFTGGLVGLGMGLGMGSFGPRAANAFENCSEIMIRDIWKGLESAFSIPCGPQDREELIYAFVAPWCPFCAEMKDDAIAGRIPARLRMIPTEPRDSFDRRRIAYLVENGTPAIDRFFDRRQSPPVPAMSDVHVRHMNDVQLLVQHSMRRVFASAGVDSGFPMWTTYSRKSAWLQNESIFLMGGWMDDPSKIARNLDIVPHSDPDTSAQWQAFNDVIETRRPFRGSAHTNRAGVVARALPMQAAMPTFCYDEGYGHTYTEVVTSAGRDWLVTPIGSILTFVDAADMTIS